MWHLATESSGPLNRLLSFRPLTIIGMITYGLYLYHFPVFGVVQKQGFDPLIQHTLELSISAALTAFSWFVIEQPALRLKDRLTRPATQVSEIQPVA